MGGVLHAGRAVFQRVLVDVPRFYDALHVLVVSDAGDGGDGRRSGELGQEFGIPCSPVASRRPGVKDISMATYLGRTSSGIVYTVPQ